MHPALAMWIWWGSVGRQSDVPAANESRSDEETAQRNTLMASDVTALPIAMKFRLDHMRQPEHSGLQLARFHSERYRSF